MNFFSSESLFSATISLGLSDKLLIGGFAVMIIFSVVSLVTAAASKNSAVVARFLRRLGKGLIAFGISGAAWSALRYLMIPYLGTRFLALLVLLGWLVWFGFVLAYAVRRLGPEHRDWQHEQVKRKYLNS